MSLSPFKVLLFDCYGTLIDWETGMLENLVPLLQQTKSIDRENIFKIVGHHEGRIQTKTPTMLYSQVLDGVYRATAKDLNLKDDDSHAAAFGASVPKWPAFEDSAHALERLSRLGLKLVILSNVDNTSFEGSKQKLEKGFSFDALYTAEKIGSYKPSLNNFEYALQHVKEDFGFGPEDILIVANSKLHDIQPGHKKGLKAAWIDRQKAVMGVSAFKDVIPDFQFPSMDAFADAMEKDKGLN
ncbi:haloacid dehalogenase, type II, variant 1 [Cryptococcus amylolentus CBS 6039]|uniref:Haloacid dehalogenase, type II, variant 1 n=2 Tax=Cryptococcus amylolentus CBS 6039 TaxID=1295533 RepID=A0A1E3HH82_9TREE|nr:haloacid dehalogenase, type II, variant 1 [Cryptococcus amylolentus CBS 6039]ODN75485.1 haloacid dehalogenase, type II, variant 1 [Cryptococcus amylolentus CBS 6039]